MTGNVLILGIGNILLRDEGVGVRAVEAMQEMALPAGVDVVDGGTAGADLLDAIADRRLVIVMDALQGNGEPGTLYKLAPSDLMNDPSPVLSLHQVGLIDALVMARHAGCEPREVVVLGVQPQVLTYGLELSTGVAAAVPKLIDLALAEASAWKGRSQLEAEN